MGLWCVVFTNAQRNAARGPYSPIAALEPVRAADGNWLLPARCLFDLARERPGLIPTLKALPRRLITSAADLAAGVEVDAADLVKVGADEAARFKGLDTGDVTAVAIADKVKV